MTGPTSLTIMNRLVRSGMHGCAFYSGPDVLARLERRVDLDRSVETAAQDVEGSGILRATGEMPSVLDHPGGRRGFFRYEARLLRTHATVVVDGMVHDNPYHVAPDEFLRGTE